MHALMSLKVGCESESCARWRHDRRSCPKRQKNGFSGSFFRSLSRPAQPMRYRQILNFY